MIGKYLAGLAGVGLLAFALWLGFTKFGEAKYAEGRMSIAVDLSERSREADAKAFAEYRRGIQQGQAATQTFIKWREGPLRIQRETIYREQLAYAQSADGNLICFDADGLRATNKDIAAANATAFPGTATGSDPAMRADPIN